MGSSVVGLVVEVQGRVRCGLRACVSCAFTCARDSSYLGVQGRRLFASQTLRGAGCGGGETSQVRSIEVGEELVG